MVNFLKYILRSVFVLEKSESYGTILRATTMGVMPTRLKNTAWGAMLFTALSLVMAAYEPGIASWLLVLFWGSVTTILVCSKRFEEKYRKADAQRFADITEADCTYYSEHEAEIRRKLANGEVRYLVEWWEEDSLSCPENAHMEFLFTDGSGADFVLHHPTAEKLRTLLAEHGISWEPRIHPRFDSCILYPPQYAGQQFYTSDGKPRMDLVSLP